MQLMKCVSLFAMALQCGFALCGGAEAQHSKVVDIGSLRVWCQRSGDSFISKHLWPYTFAIDGLGYLPGNKIRKDKLHEYHKAAIEGAIKREVEYRTILSGIVTVVGGIAALVGIYGLCTQAKSSSDDKFHLVMTSAIWGLGAAACYDVQRDAKYSMPNSESWMQKDIDSVKVGLSELGIGFKAEQL